MNLFSYEFYALWAVSILLYYTVARNHQWFLLLLMSLVFYTYSISKAPVILLLVSILTYGGVAAITHIRKRKEISESKRKRLKWPIEGICIAALIVGSTTDWFALLGNSYFTLKAISYLNDVDRDERSFEPNFFFYLLYIYLT